MIQRRFFQLCQRLIAVAEDPVHGVLPLVQHHFNVAEGDGQVVEAPVAVVVLGLGVRIAEGGDAIQKPLPPPTQLVRQLLFPPLGEHQRFTVVEVHAVGNVVDGADGHQIVAVDLQKFVPQHRLQLFQRKAGAIPFAGGKVEFRDIVVDEHILDGADVDLHTLVVVRDGNYAFVRQMILSPAHGCGRNISFHIITVFSENINM